MKFVAMKYAASWLGLAFINVGLAMLHSSTRWAVVQLGFAAICVVIAALYAYTAWREPREEQAG